MSEFERKDECCIIDSVISNTIVLQKAHPPVLHFDDYLSFLLSCLTQRVNATVQSSLDAS